MGLRSVKIDEKAKTVTVVMDFGLEPSNSGKTLKVASVPSSERVSDTKYDGALLNVMCAVYFKPKAGTKSAKVLAGEARLKKRAAAPKEEEPEEEETEEEDEVEDE